MDNQFDVIRVHVYHRNTQFDDKFDLMYIHELYFKSSILKYMINKYKAKFVDIYPLSVSSKRDNFDFYDCNLNNNLGIGVFINWKIQHSIQESIKVV